MLPVPLSPLVALAMLLGLDPDLGNELLSQLLDGLLFWAIREESLLGWTGFRPFFRGDGCPDRQHRQDRKDHTCFMNLKREV